MKTYEGKYSSTVQHSAEKTLNNSNTLSDDDPTAVTTSR